MLKDLLREMVARDASDLYLTAGSPPVMNSPNGYVRFEADPLTGAQVDELLAAEVPEREIARFEETLELNVAIDIGEGDRFRINAFKQRGETGMVIRRIRLVIPSLVRLGLPEAVGHLAMLPRGLVLITGATGSGKSTTLASMIDHRNKHEPGHIVTIEDPIEFIHQHQRSIITQREVGIDTESFHSALMSAFRQAPTVLLIGEIRDQDSVSAALRFAETGHLVLATLHSTDARQALERIVSMHPAAMERQLLMQLALSIRGIVSQRLVRRRDGMGLVPAVEILLHSARVEEMIKEGRIDELKAAAKAGVGEGMQTFDQALFKLHHAGLIGEDEALAHADSQNDLRLRFRTEGLEKAAEADTPEEGFRIQGVAQRRRLR